MGKINFMLVFILIVSCAFLGNVVNHGSECTPFIFCIQHSLSNHQILNSVYSLTKLSSNCFKVYANEICEPEFSAFLIQGERDQAAAA